MGKKIEVLRTLYGFFNHNHSATDEKTILNKAQAFQKEVDKFVAGNAANLDIAYQEHKKDSPEEKSDWINSIADDYSTDFCDSLPESEETDDLVETAAFLSMRKSIEKRLMGEKLSSIEEVSNSSDSPIILS